MRSNPFAISLSAATVVGRFNMEGIVPAAEEQRASIGQGADEPRNDREHAAPVYTRQCAYTVR